MRTIESLENISDGKIYDIKDMVKADAGGCGGCHACCQGVGELVDLTPFDVYEISSHLGLSFSSLLRDKLELKDHKKLMLPHLQMTGEKENCAFLNSKGRCSIHMHRPNICRLFPLGRVYMEDDFKYFLQVGACVKPKLDKIKVKKWIGIENYKINKTFILQWHGFIKALTFRLKFVRDENELQEINAYIQATFFEIADQVSSKSGVNELSSETFYAEFQERLAAAKDRLGLI